MFRLKALVILDDLTYTFAANQMWTTIEPCLGIINACLPMMRPLLIAIFPAGLFESQDKTDPAVGPSTFEVIDGDSVRLNAYVTGSKKSVTSQRYAIAELERPKSMVSPENFQLDRIKTQDLILVF